MTFEEANQIYCINKEIKNLYKDLAELKQQSFLKPVSLSDMPHGGDTKDLFIEYTNSVLETEDMIRYSMLKLQRERKKFELFLNEVKDSEERLILRLRCINNMNWQEIGDEIGMDRRTASRKFYNYFKVAHNAH